MRVLATGLRFPEGPIALPDGSILLVEIERRTLTKVEPDGTLSAPITKFLSEDELTEDQKHFLQLNRELSRNWPVITEKKDAPPDAKDWENKPGKLELLQK